MRRYTFLSRDDIYRAINKLRDAFLAAKDGNEVNEIIQGLLTNDERLKIGRRILIAEYIKATIPVSQIIKELKVGKNTVFQIMKLLEDNPIAFELIEKRSNKVQREYQEKKNRSSGGSLLVYKKREYSGIKRKDITR